jgi:predicted GNAT family acetyltransferase
MLQRLPTTANWLKGLDGFCGHWITPENQVWNQRILELLGSKAIRQTRIEYSADHINVEKLQALQMQLPSGYRLERLTIETVRQRSYDLDRMGLGYVSIRDFLEQGLSFRIMKENERVAEAYSAVRSRSGMEVSIGTEPAYRRMGLAKAVGAAFTLECLTQGLTPHWSTLENPHSDRLAEKLGYTPRDRHDVLGKAE